MLGDTHGGTLRCGARQGSRRAVRFQKRRFLGFVEQIGVFPSSSKSDKNAVLSVGVFSEDALNIAKSVFGESSCNALKLMRAYCSPRASVYGASRLAISASFNKYRYAPSGSLKKWPPPKLAWYKNFTASCTSASGCVFRWAHSASNTRLTAQQAPCSSLSAPGTASCTCGRTPRTSARFPQSAPAGR